MFTRDEGVLGGAGVIVLTDTFWRNQFGGRDDVVGRSVLLDGKPHTVVGVLRPEASVGAFRQSDGLVPMPLDATAPRDQRDVLVTARLAPGVSRDQATAEVDAITARLQAAYPQTNAQVVRCRLIARDVRRPCRFPSVLLQPLGHLSVSLESAAYGRVAQPKTQIV
jgi:hypothetical protein